MEISIARERPESFSIHDVILPRKVESGGGDQGTEWKFPFVFIFYTLMTSVRQDFKEMFLSRAGSSLLPQLRVL